MVKIRSIPRERRLPSFRERVMIDVVRGTIRVRKWPKKRGPPKSEAQRFWVDWFRQANLLAKYVDAASMTMAIRLTKGSGLYPRDVLLAAMRGRLYHWADQDGWRWFSVAAIGDISESLDVLAQTVGSVLVRATDRWRTPAPGAAGDILTTPGPPGVPLWLPPAGSGGITQEELPGTPIIPDGTKNLYDFDVGVYSEIIVSLDDVGFALSDTPYLRLSVDGGVIFKAGATDYSFTFISSTAMSAGKTGLFGFTPGNATTAQVGDCRLTNLRAGRCLQQCDGATGASSVNRRSGHATFNGPITHVRLYANAGRNFNAGTIRVVGLRSS